LGEYKGNFGISLKGMTKEEQLANLPSYARVEDEFPDWKQRYIRQNRQFYKDNKKFIKEAVKQISKLPSQSWQKLEWNVGDSERKINNYLLQFRASGIRIKNLIFSLLSLYKHANSNYWLGKQIYYKKRRIKTSIFNRIKTT
jgi:DNA (cytosine-5)-methyltransferase 1